MLLWRFFHVQFVQYIVLLYKKLRVIYLKVFDHTVPLFCVFQPSLVGGNPLVINICPKDQSFELGENVL